jgi:hypothetical protein
MDQCPGNHQAALHATGQVSRHYLALVPQVQVFQILFCAFKGFFAFNAVVAGLVGNHLDDRFEHVEVELLGHESQAGLGGGRVLVAVLLTSEEMMPMMVVFPAPFGPSKPKKSPCWTSKSTPLSATRPPL